MGKNFYCFGEPVFPVAAGVYFISFFPEVIAKKFKDIRFVIDEEDLIIHLYYLCDSTLRLRDSAVKKIKVGIIL
jgi:hypothetical protein